MFSLEESPPASPPNPLWWKKHQGLLWPLLLGTAALGIYGILFFRLSPLLRLPADASSEVKSAVFAYVKGDILGLLFFTFALLLLLILSYVSLQFHSRILEVQKKTDGEKSTFVRMAADTLRTPLTGLRWVTELFLGGDLGNVTDEQRQSITHMSQAIGKVIAMVNELLQVMELSGSLIQYHSRLADVNDLIRKCLEDTSEIATAKHQVLAFGEISKDPLVMLDSSLIRHVLDALLSNAIHLTPVRGTIVAHVETTPKEVTIGITYKGEAMILKPMDESLGMVKTDIADPEDNLNLSVSWEILRAAKGRFWVRDHQEEHTLFIALPYELPREAK